MVNPTACVELVGFVVNLGEDMDHMSMVEDRIGMGHNEGNMDGRRM